MFINVALFVLIAVAETGGVSAPATNPTVAIVALDGPDVPVEVARQQVSARAKGQRVLDADDVSRKLRGVSADCEVATATATAKASESNAVSGAGAGGTTTGGTADKISGPVASPSCHRPANESAIAAMLQSAYEAEAYFQDQKADELRRKIMELFAAEPQPSPNLRQMAGESLLGQAKARDAVEHEPHVEVRVHTNEARRTHVPC